MPHTQFVTNNNLDHFMDCLERAGDHRERSIFQRLLVAEEDRFAEEQHRIDALERCLATVIEKIERHARLCEGMRERKQDMTQADALMNNLHVIHSTLILARTPQSVRRGDGFDAGSRPALEP